MRISWNQDTGKADYDLKIIKTKEELRPHGIYDPEELLPFPIYNLETKTNLTVDPARTGGQQPLLMIHPETKVETTVQPPYFVHYEMTNRMRYLLDLRKFVDGKLKFKDPETNEDILVDINKRVDPLSGEPLYGDYENPERVFVETINNGEAYIVKDPITEEIQVLKFNGEPAVDYRTHYDLFTNNTSILDDQGLVVAELEGLHKILNAEDENETEAEEMELGEITFDTSAFRTRQMKREGDGGTVDQYGRPIGTGLEQYHGGVEQDLGLALSDRFNYQATLQSPVENHIRTDPFTGAKTFVDSTGQAIASERYRLEMDPILGTLRIVDQNGTPVDMSTFSEQDAADILAQLPDGYHLSQDIDRNQIELVSPSGHILQFDPATNERVPTENQRRIVYSDEKMNQSLLRRSPDRPRTLTGGTDKRANVVGDHRRNPEEEKYFEAMKMEETWMILGEANDMPKEKAKLFLRNLIETIECEKDFINSAMKSKLKEERTYIEGLLKEKEARQ